MLVKLNDQKIYTVYVKLRTKIWYKIKNGKVQNSSQIELKSILENQN